MLRSGKLKAGQIKQQDLVCKVGDHLQLVSDVQATDYGEDENDPKWENGVAVHIVAAGQIYEVADRKGAAWDLVRLNGSDRSDTLRVMNWDLLRYFQVLPEA